MSDKPTLSDVERAMSSLVCTKCQKPFEEHWAAPAHARKTLCHDCLPRDAWKAYRQQKNAAKQRGVEFLLTFDEWWAWWREDDRWSRRGKNQEGLVMARNGDNGPYALGNIYCTTSKGNFQDIPPEILIAAALKAGQTRIAGGRDKKQPRAQRIKTPDGVFGSLALASEYYGRPANWAGRQIRQGAPGWAFVGPDEPLAPEATPPTREASAVSDWRPMDTAPKDGTWILGINNRGNCAVIIWSDRAWDRDEARSGWIHPFSDGRLSTFWNGANGSVPVAWAELPRKEQARRIVEKFKV